MTSEPSNKPKAKRLNHKEPKMKRQFKQFGMMYGFFALGLIVVNVMF